MDGGRLRAKEEIEGSTDAKIPAGAADAPVQLRRINRGMRAERGLLTSG